MISSLCYAFDPVEITDLLANEISHETNSFILKKEFDEDGDYLVSLQYPHSSTNNELISQINRVFNSYNDIKSVISWRLKEDESGIAFISALFKIEDSEYYIAISIAPAYQDILFYLTK